MNYLVYPSKVMRITQNYSGGTSHKAHSTGNPKDYSIDDGCTDGGRDWFYCGCDELKVVRITGTRNNKRTNTLWLTSTTKCDLANGKQSIATLQFIHPNDEDLLKIREGQIFHRGDKICREGNDGANANHMHLAVGLGVITNNGWVQNSKNAWVLTTTDGPIKPEDAFYVDPHFTKVISMGGIKFKMLPEAKYKTGKYKVIENAPVRKSPDTSSPKLSFIHFTEGAREQIKALTGGKARNYFVTGVVFTASEVKENDKHWWGKCPSGWVCLEHCKRI